jgi:hypothetical protein
MATTENLYTGDGSTVLFSFTFPYLEESHIQVSLNGSNTTEYTLANATTVEFNTAPAVGVAIRIYRDSDADTPEATFFPGSAIRAADLNDNFLQSLYLNQETRRVAQDAVFGGVPDGSIGTAKLATGAVTEVKLAAEAVTEAKIGTGAVTEVKIGPGAVTNEKLGIAAVSTDRVADSAITQAKIGTNVLTPTVSEINGGPLAGMRNAIINGNFDIWQRGTSFTGSEYGADRWYSFRSGTTHTVTRQAFTLGQTDVPGEPAYYHRTVVSSVADATNRSLLQQRIEGVRTFAGQQATISFWAKADASKPIAVELLQVFGSVGDAAGTTKVTLSTSWQKVTVTTNIPSINGKTIDDNDYLQFSIWFDAGSDYNARTDTLGQRDGTFDIAQVQVELGPVATTFERRPIGTELALCQRYYESNTGSSFASANLFNGKIVPALNYNARMRFSVTKRATPTITLTNEFSAGFETTPTVYGADVYGFQEYRLSTATSDLGFFSSHWTADAEL